MISRGGSPRDSRIRNKTTPSVVLLDENRLSPHRWASLETRVVDKGDPVKASATQSNDQDDPVPACNSVLPCSDNEQISAGSELQDLETASSSLIDNWIDA
jgi:hypothetical protein